jgi:hypothetical protein
MKPYSLPSIINPLYVIITGLLGIAIVVEMYAVTFPIPGDKTGIDFVQAPSFITWAFLIAVLFSVVSILLIPTWQILIRLFQHLWVHNPVRMRRSVISLIIVTIIFLIFLVVFFVLPHNQTIQYFPNPPDPEGIGPRFRLIYIYVALCLLPIFLGMLLLNDVAAQLNEQISTVIKHEKKLFEFITDYLGYQNLLQNYLIAMAVIAALNPIITAAYFSTGVEMGQYLIEKFPRQGIIIYGLILTMLMLFIYVPTYLNLSQVGRNLRDAVHPISSIENLGDTLAKREPLEKLLQTKNGLIENLKSGAFSLTPLVASIFATLFHFG